MILDILIHFQAMHRSTWATHAAANLELNCLLQLPVSYFRLPAAEDKLKVSYTVVTAYALREGNSHWDGWLQLVLIGVGGYGCFVPKVFGSTFWTSWRTPQSS